LAFFIFFASAQANKKVCRCMQHFNISFLH
jgi:hypothetical protein